VSRLRVGAGLGALFLVCVIATAPARLLGKVLPSDSVIIQGFSGTIWRGAASRCLVAVGQGYIHLGELRWSLSPLSLLTLSPSGSLESSWGRQRLKTGIRLAGSDEIELSELDAAFSGQLLRHLLPLSVKGEFTAQFSHLRLTSGLPESANGRLVWQQATWESPRGSVPLGSYAMDVEQLPDEQLEASTTTIQGPVYAEGSVSLAGNRYSVDLMITGDGDLDPQLGQALSLVSKPVTDGYHIDFNGQLTAVE
jgi:general secretion pathway protein N